MTRGDVRAKHSQVPKTAKNFAISYSQRYSLYRDFTDSGQAQDDGLSAYATRALSKYYSGHISRLKAAAYSLMARIRSSIIHMTLRWCFRRFHVF
jgi:hypothetical protein